MVVTTNPARRGCLRKARHISCSRATHSHELLYHRSKCRYVPVCCRLLFHSCGQLGSQLDAKVKKWILGLWIPGPGKSDHTQGQARAPIDFLVLPTDCHLGSRAKRCRLLGCLKPSRPPPLARITVTHILLIIITLTLKHPSRLGPSDCLFSCSLAAALQHESRRLLTLQSPTED